MATIPSPNVAGTRPRAHKSIAHMPSPDTTVDKENLTIGSAGLSKLAASSKQAGKKSRSKSIGPGGLDALKENAGNRRAVGYLQCACGFLVAGTDQFLFLVCIATSDQINFEAYDTALAS